MGLLTNEIESYLKEKEAKQPVQPVAIASSSPPYHLSWTREQKIQSLEGVIKIAGFTYRVIEKDGRILFIFDICPSHTDHDGDTYECCVMVEPDGRYSASCKHDGNAGWKDFKSAIGWDKHIGEVTKTLGIPYRGKDQSNVIAIDIDKEVKEFEEKWEKSEQKDQNSLLNKFMALLIHSNAFDRERAMGMIKKITNLPKKVLTDTLGEQANFLRQERKSQSNGEHRASPQPLRAGIQLIKYVVNADQVNQLFESIIHQRS